MTREDPGKRLTAPGSRRLLSLAALCFPEPPGSHALPNTVPGRTLERPWWESRRAEALRRTVGAFGLPSPPGRAFGEGLRDEWSGSGWKRRTPSEVEPSTSSMSRLSGLPGEPAVQVGVTWPRHRGGGGYGFRSRRESRESWPPPPRCQGVRTVREPAVDRGRRGVRSLPGPRVKLTLPHGVSGRHFGPFPPGTCGPPRDCRRRLRLGAINSGPE